MEMDTVIGDRAYSEKDNIQYANENQLNLVSRLNPMIHKVHAEKKMNLSLIKMQECTFVKQVIWPSARHVREPIM
jgi:hypothetical protein